MPNYDLDGLLHEEFERLCQSLLKKIIGPGTMTFGEGPDGGREATFQGRAPYPSDSEQWEGDWIFQVKFHDVKLLGIIRARAQIVKDLESELGKLVKRERKCNNFILITNVPLSSAAEKGTLDRLVEISKRYEKKIPHIQTWGARDICRFLDIYPEVRKSYLHYITPGDLIAELLDDSILEKADLAETVRLYVRTCYQGEGHALLHQAVEVPDEQVALKEVFIDLKGNLIRKERTQEEYFNLPEWVIQEERENSLSLVRLLLSDVIQKAVLIGGPGQGKSTLGQYLAQIHRAALLNRLQEFGGNGIPLEPTPRIPFRVMMRDFGQWLSDHQKENALEVYLSEMVSDRAARAVTSSQIQKIIKDNRCLIILDGLDEVVDHNLRRRMLDRVLEFLARCDELKAKLQVIATSRPTGYRDDFDPKEFCHLNLLNLDQDGVRLYVSKWSRARQLDERNHKELLSIMEECLEDSHVRPLMNTPLQVTILILVARTRGTPPKQREALFDEYLEVIYSREKAKGREILQTPKEVLFGLHKYLGYALHKKSSSAENVGSVLKEDEFKQHCTSYIIAKTGDTASNVERMVDQIIGEARSRLVLIVEPAPSYFGFELRSIQEFFAAAHLVETAKNSSERYERFRAISRSLHWRNIALFFSGRVGRSLPGEAATVLEVCRDVDRVKPDCYLHRGALLSLDIASDRCFIPNLTLQRSAFELGLEVAKKAAPSECIDTIIKNFETLSKDDQEQLKPLMYKQLEELVEAKSDNIEICLDCCLKLFGEEPRALAILDSLFHKTNEEAKLALSVCFKHAVNTSWLAERLVNHIDKISFDYLNSAFDHFESFSWGLLFIQKLLLKCPLEESKYRSLLEELFSKHIYGWPWLSVYAWHPAHRRHLYQIEEPELQLPLGSTTDQFILILLLQHYISIIQGQDREARYYHRQESYSWHSPSIDIVTIKERVNKILAAIYPLLHTNIFSFLPYLQIQVWVLRCWLDNIVIDEFRQFINFYSDRKQELEWLSRYIGSNLSPLPIGVIFDDIAGDKELLKECQSNNQVWQILFKPEMTSILLETVSKKIGVKRTAEITRRLNVYRLFKDYLPVDFVEQTAGGTIDSIDLPDKLLIPIFIRVFPLLRNEVQVNTQEAIDIINSLKKWTEVEGGLRKITGILHLLLLVKGFTNDELMKPYEELINSIIRQFDNEPDMAEQALLLLYIKATQLGTGLASLIPAIFTKLGQRKNANISFERITDFIGEVNIPIMLGQIGKHLGSHDDQIRRGAIRLGKALPEAIVRSDWSPLQYRKIIRNIIDWKLVWPLLQKDGEEEKICGISLLALSNYPRCPQLTDLITMIKSSTNDGELSAWVTFLKSSSYIERPRDSRVIARFLGDLLDSTQSLPYQVRLAALNSYWSIVTRFDTGFEGDESKLGLLLSVTLPYEQEPEQ